MSKVPVDFCERFSLAEECVLTLGYPVTSVELYTVVSAPVAASEYAITVECFDEDGDPVDLGSSLRRSEKLGLPIIIHPQAESSSLAFLGNLASGQAFERVRLQSARWRDGGEALHTRVLAVLVSSTRALPGAESAPVDAHFAAIRKK